MAALHPAGYTRTGSTGGFATTPAAAAILTASLVTSLVLLVDASQPSGDVDDGACRNTVNATSNNGTLPILPDDAASSSSSSPSCGWVTLTKSFIDVEKGLSPSAGEAGGFISFIPGFTFLLLLVGAFSAGAVLTTFVSSFLGGRGYPDGRREGEGEETKGLDDEERTCSRCGEDVANGDEEEDVDKDSGRPIRIFLDGAFDMMHYGHFNALRLAKEIDLGANGGCRRNRLHRRKIHLIAGIDSGEGIAACKGPPLMTDAERREMVRSCRFVDEIVEDVPYSMTPEYIEEIVQKYDIDYLIHGDDPCVLPDGSDAYGPAKRMGKFRSVPRTEGVSTTDLIGRMLAMTREMEVEDEEGEEESKNVDGVGLTGCVEEASSSTPAQLGRRSTFLTTGRILRAFSEGLRAATGNDRVIYVDGAWDVFHLGHAALLKAARQRGDYVIVGIHGDEVVRGRRRKGGSRHLPLMNLHERVLGVLGCRYVDDVLVDAPRVVTGEMIASLDISEVVRGSRGDDFGRRDEKRREDDMRERYAVPREAGIYTVIESPSDFSFEGIVRRIQREKQTFRAKFERKKSQEIEYYQGKYGTGSANS